LTADGQTTGDGREDEEQLRSRLLDSVRLRLVSDVPLGAFLSGGIDSTSIVGLMREHSSQVRTFTIGFPIEGYDESAYARIAAEHLGTEHHELQVRPDSLGILPQLVWHFDEPFADSSAIPTYFVSQATRRHVTVALTGDGGDELFAGYPRYRTIERLGAFDRLPAWMRRLTANRLWDYLPGSNERSLGRRLRYRMSTLHEPPQRRYAHWVSILSPAAKAALYSADVRDSLAGKDASAFVATAMQTAASRSPGTQARLADLATYLPGDLLPKVDVTSMASALECRAPFLDHHVVELAASLPFNTLCDGPGQKPLLTSTFPDLIPAPLRARGKMGFRIPLDHWFRHQLRDLITSALGRSSRLVSSYFCPTAVQALLDEHVSGHRNHGDRLWSLLFLENWHSMFIANAPATTPPGQLCLVNGDAAAVPIAAV
jgi:asparagine synthase (glutamine-hydrolysing)